jgi:hypothetical protein
MKIICGILLHSIAGFILISFWDVDAAELGLLKFAAGWLLMMLILTVLTPAVEASFDSSKSRQPRSPTKQS